MSDVASQVILKENSVIGIDRLFQSDLILSTEYTPYSYPSVAPFVFNTNFAASLPAFLPKTAPAVNPLPPG